MESATVGSVPKAAAREEIRKDRMSITGAKEWVRNSRLWGPILALRAGRFERAYRLRRDYYQRMLEESGLSSDPDRIVNEVRHRLRQRGHTPTVKAPGEVRTLAIVGEFSWHPALLNELRQLGPVHNCDYAKFGLDNPPADQLVERRGRFGRHVLETLRAQHKKQPFDWVFAYVNGRHLLADTLRQIHEEFGIPTVNMCLDDKNCWSHPSADGQDWGQKSLAAAFDLSWTSSSVARGWYRVEGGRPVYMPEGCDPSEYFPTVEAYDVPISFIGASYGCRPLVVRHLRRHGADVKVYGRGWGRQGTFASSPADVFSRSQVNLGIGGISFSESLTNVKGRDFDVACTGGGAYLTTFNPDLAGAFDIGREILCYGNREEAVEIANDWLKRPDDCRAMAQRARRRCLREHRWMHRFLRLCGALGVVEVESGHGG